MVLISHNLVISICILLVYLFGGTVSYNYDIGYDYRYIYKAESVVLGDFRITTIVKFCVRPVERLNNSLLCQLHVDSFTQSAGGITKTNPVGWNFDNGFEFLISEDGLIKEIAHHHEEKTDVLNLKKVLASVLSAKGKLGLKNKQTFDNWEHDHSGYLPHNYVLQSTSSGYRVHKFHESTDKVYRKHAKTLHYSHGGVIEYVRADDKVILQNKNKLSETRHSVLGEKEIEEEKSGDVKDIESNTSTEVRLVKKIKLDKVDALSPLDKYLKVKGSIVVQKDKRKTTALSEVDNNIESNVACIQSYKEEVNRNRSDCFADLVQIINRLPEEDYAKLATREFARECKLNDTSCSSRQNLFIDLLFKEGHNITQNLIIKHFLEKKDVNETVIFRIFFHIADMKKPTMALLEAVEEICLGQDHTNIGLIAMTKTHKHACLALGTLIRIFRNNSKHNEKTDHLLDSLQKWLSPHNQTNYKEMCSKKIPRRSVDRFDGELHNYTYSKMVLIHALGNSGNARDHLLTYMRPGEGDNSWRRAAIIGMRHFNCTESSAALLDLAVNDEHSLVRQQAIEYFENHPLSKRSIPQHRDIILSRHYTYQTLMRVKRGILDVKFKDGFFFAMRLPGIQWNKQMGNSALGAGIGLILTNELEIEIKPLSGHAMLNVYDDAYAKVMIGWLGIEQNLFRAHACYRGHAGYDINILKDFGVNGIQDLATIFDRIVKKVVVPIKNAVKAFKDIIQLFDNGVEYIVNKIIELVKNFPLILEGIIQNVIKAVMKVIEYGGVPWIDQIKKIIIKARYFVEDVKEDLTEFYSTIADASTVTLPYVAKKLFDSVATIISAVKNFLSNPVQSATVFGKSVLDIKLAIGMFLDVKNKVVESLSFLKGGTPFWVDYWEDFKEILGDVKDLLVLLSDKRESQSTEELEDELSTALTDGISMTREQTNIFIEAIKESFGNITTQFKNTLGDLVSPFFNAFHSVLNAVKEIKSGYTSVRDIFIKTKNIIQKIFGSKFHITFPKRRRVEDSTCGVGVWPTNTNGRYQTLGVDVRIGYNADIRCPVNGEVFRENNRVLILPTDEDFIEFEIIIENIIPNPSIPLNGQFLSAGKDIIGKADQSPCDYNSIHVSVRKKNLIRMSDSEYEYIDPSPFLDHLLPNPEWIWECKDYTYINYLSVVSADAVGETLEKLKDKISRARFEGAEDLGNEFPPEEPNYRPPEFEVASPDDPVAVGAWNKFKEGFKGLVSNFKDIAKQLFDFSNNRTGPNLLDLVNVNSYTLGRIKELLGDKVATEMKILYEKLTQLRSSISAQNLEGMSISNLRGLLSASFSTASGSKSNMVSRILTRTEKDCPMFLNRLPKGPGNVCFVHRTCNEISCAVLLSHANHRIMVTADIKMDGCLKQVNVTAQSTSVVINFQEGVEIEERVPVVSVSRLMSANLVVSITFDWSTAVISLSAELCVSDFISCLHTVPVLLNYEVDSTCSSDDGNIPVLPTMDSITVQDFIAELSENHLLDKEILKILDTIREAMMDELINDPRTLLKIMGKEFQEKVDFCAEAEIPFPTKDFVFVDEDVGPFMVGPVPLYFELGAGASVGLRIQVGLCILSFKARVTLIPWSGAIAWGGVAVKFFIFRAGIRLIGYLLETRFPITAEITYNKFPLDVKGSLDLILYPVRLKLEAYCVLEIKICFWKCFKKTITIFRGTLWTYSTRPINGNVFTNIKDEKDTSPPEFSAPGVSNQGNRRKRETTDKCLLRQIPGRNHKDPAYELQFAADDDKSNLKLYYAIGTHQGGTNVVDFTEMGGFSMLIATNDLPNAIPLYWTVKAVNSQGTDARVYCMLPTYDNTLPDGRVDPSYIYSSHPNVLTAIINVFEDSELKKVQSQAVGYSSGMYGSEIVPWKNLSLELSTHRTGISNDLKHFSVPKTGKLTSTPFTVHITHTPEDCATKCINSGKKCVSFDYAYFTESCELQTVVEGPSAKLRKSGTYMNYERLGVGHNSYERFENLPLEHGITYFINARIVNVLDYVAYLHSIGTMVDFSPPSTGNLGTEFNETFLADRCKASVAQRCVEVTWKDNHRYIIDGKGASVVFNGHTPLKDKMYTRSNHYISVNFDGFHDDETGIYQYTWAVGKSVCNQDVVNFSDPHEFLHSSKHWTHSGYEKNMFLQDGQYFMTVQCLNNVVFGGSLVTTVCHSNPLTVDTTPPFFDGVEQIYFDEHFDMLAIYYKAGDNESLLRSVDFGLGKTKYDVLVRKYSYHEPMNGKDAPFIVIEELDLEEGVPAWPRVRVDNGVGLFKAGSGPEPILIDRTSPVAGIVLDGYIVHHDLTYQSNDEQLCAQWTAFYDPESGIDHFRWGIGTIPGKDNIMNFRNFSHNTRHSCIDIALRHNTRYFSTVIVFNGALNSKDSNSTSNGVLIDTTPPLSGYAVDGPDLSEDISFSSETATKFVTWDNFSDPESGIEKYAVTVYINDAKIKTFESTKETTFVDHSISMDHKDKVHFQVDSFNKAGLSENIITDGYIIDHTPPNLIFIQDNIHKRRYQTNENLLNLRWQFEDEESGIKEYRYAVLESLHGMKKRIWPKTETFLTAFPNSSMGTTAIDLNKHLLIGATYSVHVIAINVAHLSTAHESEGVTIDPTPPIMVKVHIGLLDEDEEVEDGYVQHANSQSIRVSWIGDDPESHIQKFYVAIGTSQGDVSVTHGYIDMETKTSADIEASLSTFSESGEIYYVAVKAENGAGILSSPLYSKPIKILKENVPGVIFDGREPFHDEDNTNDRFSIAMHFQGFSSEACNIVKYEWAIGSKPYYSDINEYTEYGIVHNKTHRKAQTHVQLNENQAYHVTVRAKTGHNCHEEFIVSTSDGITTDFSPPEITSIVPENNEGHFYDSESQCLFQSYVDSFEYKWNVTDQSELQFENYSVGLKPLTNDVLPSSLSTESKIPPGVLSTQTGVAYFVNVFAKDNVGFLTSSTSLPIVADISPPTINNLTCTNIISTKQSSIDCSWQIMEKESKLKQISICVGSQEILEDVIQNITLPTYQSKWTTDVKSFSNLNNLSYIYVSLTASNVMDLSSTKTFRIAIDYTAPNIEKVEFVTWTNPLKEHVKQICQLPWTYVDVNVSAIEDKESEIDRAEICLGSEPATDNIKAYQDMENNYMTIDNIYASAGTKIYATVRAYNRVGLHSVLTSEPIIVSPDPRIDVLDGKGDIDADFQASLNVIQGSYRYSDNCPIIKAEWSVEDLTGKVIQNNTAVPGNGLFFFNDQLILQNNYLYFVKVKITDALNRTKEGKSDGITVRIQPPVSGIVRDGLGSEDIKYQESLAELSANWDAFGNEASGDPTQKIDHYEVSIGDDTRDHITRTNIHYFTNVGLNTSYTFSGLNLTSKTVRYYITVRGYSITGAFEEGYSNGVRVGYRLDIIPGLIETNDVQSSTSEMTVSWSGFDSDIGIKEYYTAISTIPVFKSNKTYPCSDIQTFSPRFDIVSPKEVGLDTIQTFKNLSLNHGMSYYVTVIARDEIGMCSSSESLPILVDTTAPIRSNVTFLVNGWNVTGRKKFFVTNPNRIEIKLLDLEDPESGIDTVIFRLNQYLDCPSSGTQSSSSHVVKETVAKNDTKVNMISLSLESKRYYYIDVTANNNAGLESHLVSPVMLFDTGSPHEGSAIIGNNWGEKTSYQSSTSRITALTAIARTEDVYVCDNTKTFFPSEENLAWIPLSGDFSTQNVIREKYRWIFNVGYNTPLTKVLKSGISRWMGALQEGVYSSTLSAAKGKNISTALIISSSKDNPYFPLKFTRPQPSNFDRVSFNFSGTEHEMSNYSYSSSSTENPTSARPLASSTLDVMVSVTGPSYETLNTDASNGFGFQVLGDQQNGSKGWDVLFWAKGNNEEFHRWTQIDNDPSENQQKYSIRTKRRNSENKIVWDLEFSINGDIKANIYGLSFDAIDLSIFVQTWNFEDYEEPITDPIHPYRSQAVLSKLKIPTNATMDCLIGKGFYDGESGISEIWTGISDNIESYGNVRKMELHKKMCTPCLFNCNFSCDVNCSLSDKSLSEFEIIPLTLDNLDLKTTIVSNDGLNASVKTEIVNMTEYYVNVKMVNFAGQAVSTITNPVIVDKTPPVCEYIRCLDPDVTGMDAPTDKLGSNKTIGAYWLCEDNISGIKKAYVKVGTETTDSGHREDENMASEKDIGAVSKIKISLDDNVYFEDRKTYFVNLVIFNGAGLSTVYSCNVSTILTPPDVSDVDSNILLSSERDQTTGTVFADSLDRFGISWNNRGNDTDYYKWQMGTYEGGGDIIPPTIIGLTREGTAEVISGELWLNGNKTGKSLAALDPGTWGNLTESEINKTESDFRFRMEPGRCVFLSLIAVGYSSLEANISSQRMCFKRKNNDLFLNNQHNNITTVAWLSNDRFEEIPQINGNEAIVISITGQITGVSVGSLSESDLQAEYGTASSFEFRSYLTNPNTTNWPSRREIRNRIVKPLEVNFFIAPTPTIDMEFIDVDIRIQLNDFDNSTVPALLIWDAYTFNSDTKRHGIWRHVGENCGGDITDPTIEGNIYKAKICQETFQMLTRRKRSPAVTVTNPYQFTLVVMNVSFYNSPPEVDIDTILTTEDTPIIDFQIPYHDDEMDSVQFYLLQNSDIGFANLTLNGSLTYYPKPDFFGKDSIRITLTDNAKYPATTEKIIWIKVNEVNDMPMFGFHHNYTSYDVKENKSLTLIFEGNSTSNYLFDFGFADVDENETLSFISSLTNTKDVNITTTSTDNAWFLNDTFGHKEMKTKQGYAAEMAINKNFHGDFYYYILGFDSHSYYTERLETHIFILWSPCVYGVCSPKFNTSPSCQDISRADSFDFYKCLCDPGYSGMWCENEINECQQQPCGDLFNCEDKINSYECVIKPEALVSLIVAAILFIILVVILYRFFRCKTKPYRVTTPLSPDEDESFDDFDTNTAKLIEYKNSAPIATDCKFQNTENKMPPYSSFITSQETSRKGSFTFIGDNNGQDYKKNIEGNDFRSTGHTDNLYTNKKLLYQEKPFYAKILQNSEKKKPMKRVPFLYPSEHDNAAYSPDISENDSSDDEQFGPFHSAQNNLAKVLNSEKSQFKSGSKETFCFQNLAYFEPSTPKVEIQRNMNFPGAVGYAKNRSPTFETCLHKTEIDESPTVPKSDKTCGLEKIKDSEKLQSKPSPKETFCFQNLAYSDPSTPKVEIQRNTHFQGAVGYGKNRSPTIETCLHKTEIDESPLVTKSGESRILETAENASINNGQETERRESYDDIGSSKPTEVFPRFTKGLAAAKNFTTPSTIAPTILRVASPEECPVAQMSDSDEEIDRYMTSTPIGISIDDMF
ncbi:uncharacterized protein LOC133178169 [Saccostrea echinata]|uniref:uncharacterized protein LOC133178169 n=1 Tax=Saccostrea echinata TaxID=191078 RepID=UPI002A7F527A|nr:uncharacterized protein LOC133178169 [Saccostrea echinata]